MSIEPEWGLLAGLKPEQRRAFLEACGKPRHFTAGQRLVHRDAPPRGLFLVRSGHVAVIVTVSFGEEQIVNILGPGSTIGELALIDDSLRSASVEALDDCDAYFMSRADFERFRAGHPELDRALLRHVVGRVRELTADVADARRPAVVRVVRSLLRTAAAFGQCHPDGIVPISHATLATVTGVGETTVQTELRRLQRQGLVGQDRRKIRLRDLDGLHEIADDASGDVIG